MIKPHGDKLINRNVSNKKRKQLLNEYQEMSKLSVSNETVEDLFNIGYGVFSPLEGFMSQEDIN
jgi:sulfate adenylyltransferase